jgi:prepilin-type N-terminal cleavage/methylation domain-containing protein
MTIKNLKENKGFTIVETLIVLAIAAVIIIIVLLAVPALQRTSRNTNIKTDATTVAGAISEWESNNSGGLPNKIAGSAGTLTVSSVSSSTCGSAAQVTGANQSTVAIGSTTTVVCDNTASANAPTYASSAVTTGTSPKVAPGTIIVLPNTGCTSSGSPVSGPSSFAVFYPIEGPSQVGCAQG